MSKKKTWPAGENETRPHRMQSFCVSCGANQEVIDERENLPEAMPLQCGECVANNVKLPKGYE